MTEAPALQALGITKRFGPVTALDDVSIEAGRGEIIGLIGVNGAGKSTLMNILDGVFRPTAGEIRVNGAQVSFANPQQARKAGIGFIHQHSTCFGELSVAENISIQADRAGYFSRRRVGEEAKRLLAGLGAAHVDVRARVAELTIGERQMVDVARVLIDNPSVILFDEPTSSLSRAEAENLFDVIRALRAEGRTIFYTSHFLDDVLDLADRVVVLRDGKVVMDEPHEDLTRERLVSAMLSRDLTQEISIQRPEPQGEVVLSVRNLAPRGARPISFDLRRGEVLGIWGLLGAGRTEILRALVGLDPARFDEIKLAGKGSAQDRIRPRDLIRHTGFVPEDRHHDGLYLGLPVWQNVTAASNRAYADWLGRMRDAAEKRDARAIRERLGIKVGDMEDPVSSLSGGNQQKAIFGRWLIRAPDIYLLDEPTHGVDVGAKAQIHDVIHEVADRGASIIVISSEVEEMFALADRILILRDGALNGEMLRRDFHQQRLLAAS